MTTTFKKTFSRIIKSQKQLRKLFQKATRLPAVAKIAKAPARPRPAPRRLTEITGFGSNPGRLGMMTYVPPQLPANAPLVVVLHGCMQTPESFDLASRFSALARERGFALLYPRQTASNNSNLCFTWFRPSAVARDRGELMSIRQMIDHACASHRLDRSRIYVAGLSAGGAMANALLATYPELFAAGAIVAGLPFGAARDAMTAMSVMKSGVARSSVEWGDLVRAVSPTTVRWPAISIWQGSDDRVVSPVNADACLQQWLDVQGLDASEGRASARAWGTMRQWRQGDAAAISVYTVAGMGHGLPVRAGKAKASDRFVLDALISAPVELMQLWGLKRRR